MEGTHVEFKKQGYHYSLSCHYVSAHVNKLHCIGLLIIRNNHEASEVQHRAYSDTCMTWLLLTVPNSILPHLSIRVI